MSLTNANCSAAKRSSPTIGRWGRQQVKNLGYPRSVLGQPLPRSSVRGLNSADGGRQAKRDGRQPAMNILDGKIFEDGTNPGRAERGGITDSYRFSGLHGYYQAYVSSCGLGDLASFERAALLH